MASRISNIILDVRIEILTLKNLYLDSSHDIFVCDLYVHLYLDGLRQPPVASVRSNIILDVRIEILTLKILYFDIHHAISVLDH